MPDTEFSQIDGKINDIGKLEAHVHYEFRGDEELLLRSVFRRVPQANWQRVVENVNAGLGGDITNLKISDPAATREPFTMSYDVSKVNFLDWSKKKTDIVLPLVQFNLPDVDADDSDPDAEPLKLGPKARVFLQDQTGIAREVHRPRAAGFLAEARLRRIRGHVQNRGQPSSPPAAS